VSPGVTRTSGAGGGAALAGHTCHTHTSRIGLFYSENLESLLAASDPRGLYGVKIEISEWKWSAA